MIKYALKQDFSFAKDDRFYFVNIEEGTVGETLTFKQTEMVLKQFKLLGIHVEKCSLNAPAV